MAQASIVRSSATGALRDRSDLQYAPEVDRMQILHRAPVAYFERRSRGGNLVESPFRKTMRTGPLEGIPRSSLPIRRRRPEGSHWVQHHYRNRCH